jgi:hypothetical protein
MRSIKEARRIIKGNVESALVEVAKVFNVKTEDLGSRRQQLEAILTGLNAQGFSEGQTNVADKTLGY